MIDLLESVFITGVVILANGSEYIIAFVSVGRNTEPNFR